MLFATIEMSAGEPEYATSTPAYVQSSLAHGATAVSLSSAVTGGNLVVVGITTTQTIPVNAITDNKGNTYTKAAEAINGSNHAAIFYASNVTGGASFQVSSSVSGTIAAHEYSGVALTNALDQTHTGTGSSKNLSSGNVTTAAGPELYFGLGWSSGSNNSWSAGTNYTMRQSELNNTSYVRFASEDRVITSSTTVAATFTVSGAKPWAAAIATFKPLVTSSGGGNSSAIHYVHADHLGSTAAETDSTGNVTKTLDYYPYGSTRVDAGSSLNKRGYIGQFTDDSGLSYLNARYYEGSRGQFLSEDPVFWEVGQTAVGRAMLQDPQAMNSYSYAKNNPITNKDPDGRIIPAIVAQAAVMIARAYLINLAFNETALVGSNMYGNVQQGIQNNTFSGSSFIPTVTGQQYLNTAGEALPPSLLGPAGGLGAKFAGFNRLLGSSIGIGVGAGYSEYNSQMQNGEVDYGKVGFSALTNFGGNYAGGKIIGNTVGRDVKSVFSPNFYTGVHMQNEVKSGAISQSVISAGSAAYSGIASSLRGIVASLQSIVSSLQSSSNKK